MVEGIPQGPLEIFWGSPGPPRLFWIPGGLNDFQGEPPRPSPKPAGGRGSGGGGRPGLKAPFAPRSLGGRGGLTPLRGLGVEGG